MDKTANSSARIGSEGPSNKPVERSALSVATETMNSFVGVEGRVISLRDKLLGSRPEGTSGGIARELPDGDLNYVRDVAEEHSRRVSRVEAALDEIFRALP